MTPEYYNYLLIPSPLQALFSVLAGTPEENIYGWNGIASWRSRERACGLHGTWEGSYQGESNCRDFRFTKDRVTARGWLLGRPWITVNHGLPRVAVNHGWTRVAGIHGWPQMDDVTFRRWVHKETALLVLWRPVKLPFWRPVQLSLWRPCSFLLIAIPFPNQIFSSSLIGSIPLTSLFFSFRTFSFLI